MPDFLRLRTNGSASHPWQTPGTSAVARCASLDARGPDEGSSLFPPVKIRPKTDQGEARRDGLKLPACFD